MTGRTEDCKPLSGTPQFVSAVSCFELRSDCKMQNAVITGPANDKRNVHTVHDTDCTACVREMNVC